MNHACSCAAWYATSHTGARQETLAPWIESLGFIQGANEPCAFLHPDRDLNIVTYVDDVLADGDEEDIKWFFRQLRSRFECKETEWLQRAVETVPGKLTVNLLSQHCAYHGFAGNFKVAFACAYQ